MQNIFLTTLGCQKNKQSAKGIRTALRNANNSLVPVLMHEATAQ